MATTAYPFEWTRRWTRAEYERLIDLGAFGADEHVELLDGQLVVGEPQSSRHAAAVRRVLAALGRVLGEGWQLDSQLPIALDDRSLPEPDVAVVPRVADAYRDAHPSRAGLIVEIADSSYRIDRQYKASLYARAGVAEYWILDLGRAALEVHREPQASRAAVHGWIYRRVETLRSPSAVAPLIARDSAIPVADLLP
jgi:Uma2 family endonuclease